MKRVMGEVTEERAHYGKLGVINDICFKMLKKFYVLLNQKRMLACHTTRWYYLQMCVVDTYHQVALLTSVLQINTTRWHYLQMCVPELCQVKG